MVLLHDFLEQAASRGRAVPPTMRRSLNCRAKALEIEWPLDHPLICSAVSVESTAAPKHSPSMPLETVKFIDGVATNQEVAPVMRAFAAGILLMDYASLRFSDVQRLKTSELNADSAHGALLRCKTKKPHGLDCPPACPRMGIACSIDWVLPLIELRTAFAKTNGKGPCFTSPRINRAWELDSAEASPYPITRRKLATLCTSLGDVNGNRTRCIRPKTFSRHRPLRLGSTLAN